MGEASGWEVMTAVGTLATAIVAALLAVRDMWRTSAQARNDRANQARQVMMRQLWLSPDHGELQVTVTNSSPLPVAAIEVVAARDGRSPVTYEVLDAGRRHNTRFQDQLQPGDECVFLVRLFSLGGGPLEAADPLITVQFVDAEGRAWTRVQWLQPEQLPAGRRRRRR